MSKLTLSVLVALSILALVVVGGGATRTNLRLEPVAQTMSSMRLAGFALEAYRRERGTYPLADGEIRSLAEIVMALDPSLAARSAVIDAWGHPILFRAKPSVYQLISKGSDGQADVEYADQLLYPGRKQQIADATRDGADSIMVDGRFLQRPFGDKAAAFATVNAINSIVTAAESYAVDYNFYPNTGGTWAPVAVLEPHLVPIYLQKLPELDGWNRSLRVVSDGTSLTLASYGADGTPDIPYYSDLPCGVWDDAGPSAAPGADIVHSCGRFTNWVAGTEP